MGCAKGVQNVCVWFGMRMCDFFFFYWGLGAAPAFLKGERQLPFTAPGGNKRRGRGSYLALLQGQEVEEGAFIGVTL